jgi:outer membrane protein assembly factor BamB
VLAAALGLTAAPALALGTGAGVPASTAPASTGGHGGCSVANGSWPMYQGGPSHNANACSSITTANAPTLHPAWFVRTPGTVSATPTLSGGTLYVGDSTGVFYALDQATGATRWTFNAVAPQTCFVDRPDPNTEQHRVGNPDIETSAAVAQVGGRSIVYFGAGGTLFALDAAKGSCLWATDVDPSKPSSPTQVESSPVVDTSVSPPEVLVGEDDNSSSGVAVTGLLAFNAGSGSLLWKYEPERDLTLTPSEFGGSDALTMSCGTGTPVDTYCTPENIRDLPPNSASYADGCGDVWSSPALDSSFADPAGSNVFEGSGTRPAGWYPKQITATGRANRLSTPDGLVVFGTGNCSANPNPSTALAHGDYADNPGVFALDPKTGVRVWNFIAPYNLYDNNVNEPGAGDDDFGSSAVLVTVPSSSVSSSSCAASRGATRLVVEGSKDGYAYARCETTGRAVWTSQVAQAGQASADLVGSIGGILGSPAVGTVAGRATIFFTSAAPLPFTNDGIREPGDGDKNISHCPGAGLEALPLLPACPDTSLLNDPTRIASLHAVDASTGRTIWRAPTLPTYAGASVTNQVVFDPETVAFGIAAFDADTGTPLWAFPLAASPSSAAAIAGNSIYLGAGTDDGGVGSTPLPPQAFGIWSFTTAPPSGL